MGGQSESVTDRVVHEGVALLIVGLVVAATPLVTILVPEFPSWAFGIALAAWIVWFFKWAVAGGMPRVH